MGRNGHRNVDMTTTSCDRNLEMEDENRRPYPYPPASSPDLSKVRKGIDGTPSVHQCKGGSSPSRNWNFATRYLEIEPMKPFILGNMHRVRSGPRREWDTSTRGEVRLLARREEMGRGQIPRELRIPRTTVCRILDFGDKRRSRKHLKRS